ncbi:hypothetical protein ACFYT3_21575 [Nocardia amikacinitolerans]|uniref:hypothetical protein n=1 Tax=Nocardia amikacinitolerans TaxID=756689 RepID=UPI0036AFCC6D
MNHLRTKQSTSRQRPATQLFQRQEAHDRNGRTRKKRAVFMVDSGIATYLRGADPRALRPASGPLGPLLERLVAAELAPQLTISRKIDGSQMAAYQDQLSAI